MLLYQQKYSSSFEQVVKSTCKRLCTWEDSHQLLVSSSRDRRAVQLSWLPWMSTTSNPCKHNAHEHPVSWKLLAAFPHCLFWFPVNKNPGANRTHTYSFHSILKSSGYYWGPVNRGRCTDLQDWKPVTSAGQIRALCFPMSSWKAGGGSLLISIYSG